MVESLYTGRLSVGEEELVTTTHVLRSLMLSSSMQAACAKKMVQRVNEENVDQMLSVGEELGNHILKSRQGGQFHKNDQVPILPWIKEEDDRMVELVAQFDVRSWSALMYMPGDSDGRNHQLQ